MNLFKSIPILLIAAVVMLSSCRREAETCSDGIRNQDETAIDCGGVCTACPTCSDGILNQNETGIDCGGSCPVCPTCSDGIKNQDETGIDCGGVCSACLVKSFSAKIGGTQWNSSTSGIIINTNVHSPATTVYGTDINNTSIQIAVDKVPADINVGTYTSYSFGTSYNYKISGTSYICSNSNGSITFTLVDKVNKRLSGTFSFTCSTSGGINSTITSGSFENLTY